MSETKPEIDFKQEINFEKRSAVYEFIRGLAIVVFHTLMPVKFHNRERLDREAPFVMISNHLSAMDPVAIALGLPKRQIVFLGKKELGKNKLARKIMTSAHCILVARHGTDMAAMRNCMKAVKAKQILLIFPEGTRHHEGQMQEIESGASLIAMRCGVPIVPVYLERKISFFRTTHIHVGDPIPSEDLIAQGINSETCEEMNERFRATFRKMVEDGEKAHGKK